MNVQSKQALKRLIARVFRLYCTARVRNLSVILNYHSIHPAQESSTRPEDFLTQMRYLQGNFSVVSLAEFLKARMNDKDLPPRTALITFDDGYKNNYDYAFPVLQTLGLPATIFLATGFVNGEIDITEGWKDYRGMDHLNWTQVKEMGEGGVSFGAHSHSHPILSKLSLCEAEKEILHSKEMLEESLGQEVRHFAYPLGQPCTFNASIINLLKKHGFDLACSTIWGAENNNTHMFALRRVRIDACDSNADFVSKINGYWDFVRQFQVLRGIYL